MIEKLQFLIQKYSNRVTIPTIFLINDMQDIINWELNKKKEPTLLEDVQELYKLKFGSIPNNKKNDIQWLTSKL